MSSPLLTSSLGQGLVQLADEREREAQNGAEAVVQKRAPFVRASW